MIKFTNVYKKYTNGYEALVRLNFYLKHGEMVFLTGHSGAGKSTFLKIAGSLERATRGQVEVNGINLMALREQDLAFFRRRVGIVLQDPHLLLKKTAYDNVALPLIIEGMGKIEASKRVRAALDKVGLLGKIKFMAEELSTGERQRVGLARAVVNKPDLILADEPTGNLDADLSKEIFQLFVAFNQVGTSVLIASHDMSLMNMVACRIVRIEGGRLIEATEKQA